MINFIFSNGDGDCNGHGDDNDDGDNDDDGGGNGLTADNETNEHDLNVKFASDRYGTISIIVIVVAIIIIIISGSSNSRSSGAYTKYD